MFFRTIFVCLVGCILAISAEEDPVEILFKITSMKGENNTKSKIICDHVRNGKQQKMYTVLEGKSIKIITDNNKNHINDLICSNNNDYKDLYSGQKIRDSKNGFTLKVEKRMGTLWNCTVLTNRNAPGIVPVVYYDKDTYFSAAYCSMKIHVRQKNSPQTILVNNMVLHAVRTDLSEKDVDFTTEYQYAAGDVVDVTCINFLNESLLTMEYAMAGTKSNNSIMKELSSYKAISFRVKLHSGHNNSSMICTNTESTDYTKVRVRFIMRTEFNIVSIKINGMTLQPKLKFAANNQYEIDYKYLSNQYMKVVCEVQRTDVKLVVMDKFFVGKVGSYSRTDGIPQKQAEMLFYLNATDKTLTCSSDYYNNGPSAELVCINFTEGKFPIDQYNLQMDLPSNGTVMQLFNGENKLKVIYYEFEDGETLELKCGPLLLLKPGPVLYLQFKDSDKCDKNGCALNKKLHVTRKHENTEIVCYLKEKQYDPLDPGKKDVVLREIRVILRKRVLTTTSSTTSTTTTTTVLPIAETSPPSIHYGASESGQKGNDDILTRWVTLAVIIGAVLCIIIICVSIFIAMLRKRNHSQGGPHDRNYQNLQSPSEASIPACPPQWESTYAVPVDRRVEDTTYSVPCQEPALYSTPTPKNLRNKNQKQVDPTYAVLEVPNARGRKNIFKETDDPNYSEVYANRQEQCYGKVLPKSVRNKMALDNNPYSYVTNEPAYVNTDEPEPMYCEPAKAQGGTYANLNNAHYANSNAQEYVEPTYCEPQKRK